MSEKPGSKTKDDKALKALVMFDNVDMAFLAIDKKSTVTYANRMAEGFFGRPGCSLVGAGLLDLLEPSLRHTGVFGKFYDRVLTTGKAGELEVPVHNFRRALFHLYPQEEGMAIVVEDVTHRHIREEPQRTALLTFNSLPEAVFLVYENGGIYYANDAACGMTGRTLEELKALQASEIIPALDPRAQVHNGRPVPGSGRFESVLWPKSGDAIPVEVFVTDQTLFRRTNYIVSVRDITERKKALGELVRLGEKTRDLLKRAPTGIYELDFRGPRLLMVNDFVCEATGYTREELLEMSPFDLVADESKALFRERIRRQLAGEKVDDTVEYRGKVKDGREMFWVLKVTLTYENGRPVGAIVVGNDITERKRAEEALRLASFTVDKARDIVMWFNPDGRICYANDAACEKFGYSRDELLSRTIFDLNPRYSRDQWNNRWQALKSKGTTLYEVENRTRDGHWFPIDVTNTYIKYGDREFMVGYARDITERRRAVERLRESEEKFRNVFEQSSEGILLVGPDGNIAEFNEALSRITGLVRAEWIGRPVDEFAFTITRDARKTPERKGQMKEAMRNFIDHSINPFHRKEVEITIQRPDREIRVTHMANFTVDTSRGQMFGCMVRDVTERKQTEEALKDAKAQSELYLDLMGHDINNMHQIALGYLELAQGLTPDVQGEMIEKSIEVLQRSARLIRNVRKLQKHGDGMFQSSEYDLVEVLTDVGREFGAVPGKTVTLNLNGHGHCHVRANELLHDVFTNLVGNAIKHTGDRANISVGLDTVDDNGDQYYRISVEDDGPGIPDDFKGAIFNRALKGTSKARGMGLGLYLVKSLIDSYGGRVRVEDRIPGDHTKGARFVVILPVV